jgi:hypothetical protein
MAGNNCPLGKVSTQRVAAATKIIIPEIHFLQAA